MNSPEINETTAFYTRRNQNLMLY